jgi:small subunit ribosomal protein S1
MAAELLPLLQRLYVGREVEVSLMAVSVEKRGFTASMTIAQSDRVIRQLRVGSLISGHIRRIESYGAFVGIADSHVSGMLHVSNISWERVRAVEDVFEVGDKIRAVVIGMEEGFKRIAVSTRDLEAEEGLMLHDKASVFAQADSNVKRFQEHVKHWEEGQGDGEGSKQD